jgi:hypothetical protein
MSDDETLAMIPEDTEDDADCPQESNAELLVLASPPIPDDVQEFYSGLLEYGRKRISIDIVRKIFAQVYPERESHPQRTAYLKSDLQLLVESALLAYPSKTNRKGWLPETSPILPAWIVLIARPQPKPVIDAASIPWLAELSFCTELTRTRSLEAALAINNFLIEHRHDLISVPLRERSLQIFGDEKRLDALVGNGALFGGRLPLSAIGAFELEQPLVFELGQAGKPLLVVENHHTYWSVCQWNKRARKYSAIVYGAGGNFSSTGNAIDVVLNQVNGTGIEYFGDIDPAGLEIPYVFSARRFRTGYPGATPAKDLYGWLLERGVKRTFVESNALAKSHEDKYIEWLGCDGQITGVKKLFQEKLWIPQESLGTEALLKFF